MCGIAGIFAYRQSAPLVDTDELLRIREQMIRRGPDGAGLWMSHDKRVGLAHRRLAVIDLSEAGAQPMATADGLYRITFNGEIYNYRELRKNLEAKGYRFHSDSDTEVLLHLYADRGEAMVHALRGMYAFAIWDERKRGMFMARDPFGIKPLYYADDGSTIRIASQVKALLKGGAIKAAIEPAGHVGFYLWGHVPEPYTLYKEIRALEAGTSLWIDAQAHKAKKQFFSITEELAKGSETRPLGAPELHERLHAVLLDSVRHHMIADVPVGIFLSAGLDSSTLTALARETPVRDLRTITLGFREFQGTLNDEVPLAEEIARHYGTLHQTRWVTKADFHLAHKDLLEAMDQPTTDGVNSYFVSQAAAESGLKVALSGLGADELFGGYDSFGQLPLAAKLFRPFQSLPYLGKGFRYVSAPILKQFTSAKYAGILEYGGSYGGAYLLRRGMYMPWELPDVLDREVVREGWQELQTLSCLRETTRGIDNPHLRVSSLESTWYMRNQLLRDSDWASMAHSLEIRVPFVDIELFRAVAPMFGMPNPPGKQTMARTPVVPLPETVLLREKTGFLVPTRVWLLETSRPGASDRGLRGWAKYIHAANSTKSLRVLALLTDAFGGHGGIGLYNRDFLTALCSHPDVSEVVAFPRNIHHKLEAIPAKLAYMAESIGGKFSYLSALFKFALKRRKIDLVVCGHIHLLPLAYLFRCLTGAPVLLEIYGIEAWKKPRGLMMRYLASRVPVVVSISEITRNKFLGWIGKTDCRSFILPNAIHAERYGLGSKNPSLLARYHLEDAIVLMTLGRIVPSEGYKGFDEIIEVLPTLLRDIPKIAYLIVGDGPDVERLKNKALELGVSDRVVFTGRIAEEEKADHYRLADAYVMPSYGEGFGFVFLEALACGIPVVASKADGGREAIRDGQLGILVDPGNPAEIVDAIRLALGRPKEIPDGLRHFSFENFQCRTHEMIDVVLPRERMLRQQ